MAGYIEDRWWTKKPDPKTGKKRRTARYKQGKRWRVAGVPGVRDRSFDNLKGPGGAEEWLATAKTDTGRGEFYDPRQGEMTLDEYVREHWWPNLRRTPTTKESMENRVFRHILPHAGQLPLNRIGHDEVKAWQTRAEQDIDVGTLAVTWHNFSSIMQAAYKAKRIPLNPFRDEDLKPPTVPKSKAKAWPQETVSAVREALSARYRVLVDLGVGSGLRQGEAFGFSPDDIDGEEITVVRQVIFVRGRPAFGPPKGNKERRAPCPPELARAIKEHANLFPPVEVTLPWVDPDRPNMAWEDRPKKTVRLLVTTPRSASQGTGAVSRGAFNEKQWKPALVRAGVIPAPVTEYIQANGKQPWARKVWEMPREDGFHVTRHTFASIVLAAGETITQLAAWLGHSDPAFTLRTYVHFMPTSGSMGLVALGQWVSAGAGAAPVGEADEAPVTSPGSDSPQILPNAGVDQGS